MATAPSGELLSFGDSSGAVRLWTDRPSEYKYVFVLFFQKKKNCFLIDIIVHFITINHCFECYLSYIFILLTISSI